MRAAPLLVVLLLAIGCAQHGLLELQIRLPPAPAGATGRWVAEVQARAAAPGAFGSIWTGNELRAVELGSAAQWSCASVQSADPSVDLDVRVRFCREACRADVEVAEARFHLERPIYVGRRTYWSTTVARVPECASDLDCALGVCVDGRCGCARDADCCPPGACACPEAPCATCEAGGCVEQVGYCRIEGCTTGTVGSDFCNAEGRHHCESSSVDRREAYQCGL